MVIPVAATGGETGEATAAGVPKGDGADGSAAVAGWFSSSGATSAMTVTTACAHNRKAAAAPRWAATRQTRNLSTRDTE